jgi:hypothetical protein
MTINTFWTILLKVMGLWFIFVSLGTIVQILSMLLIFSQNSHTTGIDKILLPFVIFLTVTLLFILMLWLMLFKSAWVIEKLKLTKGFTEERIELNMEWSTVLTIATIVIGGLMVIDSLPLLCKQTVSFFQHANFLKDSQESMWILFYLIKTLLGYLLMTNSQYVVRFLGRQNDKNNNSPTDSLTTEA